MSSVSTTNSSVIGRVGGSGCPVSVDGVGVSKNDVSHGRDWAGVPEDQLYIVFTGNTDNFSKTVHQFKNEKKKQRKEMSR